MLYSLVFYVPKTHCDGVKSALFNKGAGRFNQYDCCAFQVEGVGQFRPRPGSRPFIGTPDRVETVPEYRVEMICQPHYLKPVIEELLRVHPYEEVAYHAWPVTTIEDLSSESVPQYPNGDP